jgi:uncharacterized phage protein (TIGR02220 family)
MTLFAELSPKSQKLIDEHTDLINEHLEEWINNELGSNDKKLAEDVLMYFTLAKRRKKEGLGVLKVTPHRKNLIKKIAKLGNGIDQFVGVVDYMIMKFWGTKYQQSMITPEFMFRPAEFQKYLEEARDYYLENKPTKKSLVKNQYEELISK